MALIGLVASDEVRTLVEEGGVVQGREEQIDYCGMDNFGFDERYGFPKTDLCCFGTILSIPGPFLGGFPSFLILNDEPKCMY